LIPTPDVIAAAQAAQKATRVPASVSIAQYGLESGWGQHMPPGTNNPFGIKDFKGGVESETTEDVDGKVIDEKQPFMVFESIQQAFIYHANLLATSPIYASAFTLLPNVTNFVMVMARHYATDPNYASKILAIINGDNLSKYNI